MVFDRRHETIDAVFNKKQLNLAIEKIRWWEKVLLWFRPWIISTDWDGENMRAAIFAKELFGKIYILNEKIES